MYPDVMKSGFEEQSKYRKNIQKHSKVSAAKASKVDEGVDLKHYILLEEPTKIVNAQSGKLIYTLSQEMGGQELLVSKYDGKLLIDLHFKQEVCVSTLCLRAPQYNAPQTVKIFVDCEVEDWVVPWQGAAFITTLTPQQFQNGFAAIQLGQETNFRGIKSLQLEVQTNQSAQGLTNLEPTIIQSIILTGKTSGTLPQSTSNSLRNTNNISQSSVLKPLNYFRSCVCVSNSLVQAIAEEEEERSASQDQNRRIQ
eukprot:TRINITY_DN22_c0_g2_i1.p1 TRINITY_DN22_c0_g2~~TRINITY_DN22_c0_g2_i1.p1  ORF type:complete len:253 (+),score=6.71 TRINITY_DN22_c0_g2_i1:102-860(+)